MVAYAYSHPPPGEKEKQRVGAPPPPPRQNVAGPRASTTQYWENLIFVVVLVPPCVIYARDGRSAINEGKTEKKKSSPDPFLVITSLSAIALAGMIMRSQGILREEVIVPQNTYLCKKTSTSGLMLVFSAFIWMPNITTAITPDIPNTSSPM